MTVEQFSDNDPNPIETYTNYPTVVAYNAISASAGELGISTTEAIIRGISFARFIDGHSEGAFFVSHVSDDGEQTFSGIGIRIGEEEWKDDLGSDVEDVVRLTYKAPRSVQIALAVLAAKHERSLDEELSSAMLLYKFLLDQHGLYLSHPSLPGLLREVYVRDFSGDTKTLDSIARFLGNHSSGA